ncbi:MAG: tRNA (adenosine(37)-N6)-threonylcarbamoyltransferase complex dimerization subunit type 1 TsaB [Clostridia bacterium]|nr:tRNA (adenosine(37)-N6)-threonylcarbamoyltransferase complex dimerization subunit type 1 TsaB [Clostridia bacterium]
MKILCLNTAFSMATICLENNGKKVLKTLDANAKSSEKVLPEIENILVLENLKIADIDFVAVVVGPGSFTGIRIGVALVKGFMCCFPNLKVVAINSLDLMAFEFAKTQNKKEFFCIQNALSGRFFVAKFDNLGKPISENLLTNEVPKGVLVGLETEKLEMANHYVFLTPENLLEFANAKIKSQNFVDLNNLTPIYLRLSQAEENLLKKDIKC